MSALDVRLLTPADVAAYRALRLRGLRETPEAFGATYEEDAALPDEVVAERLQAAREPAGRVTVGVFDGDALVGVAACVQAGHTKARHTATVFGMYVAPEARGRGAGRALVARLVEEARAWGEVERIVLTVVERAEAARRLYRAAGFVPYGREPDALRQDGVRDTVIAMGLELAAREAPRPTMEPRLTVLTLGVDDLARAVAFYRDGLGWPTDGIIGEEFAHGAVAFFDLDGGVRLALWPRASLAHDAGLPLAPPSATEVSLGHNVPCAAEVDAVMQAAGRAGARIVKTAGHTFWGGYAGYFQDPDGHLWEVVWNPAWHPAP